MNGSLTVYLLRAIHIVAGALWVGTTVFLAAFLVPAVRAVGPAGGPIMQQLGAVRRMPLFMMLVALCAVLSGLGLYWRDSAGFQSPWLSTPSAMTFGTGGVLALAALVVGMGFTSPAGRRMSELAGEMQRAGAPPSPTLVAEMQRLQARLAGASTIVATLLVLATLAMAVARYV